MERILPREIGGKGDKAGGYSFSSRGDLYKSRLGRYGRLARNYKNKKETEKLRDMPLYIPHRYPKYFESVTLIQPQHKGGAFKGPAKGQCLNCMDKQEYDLTVPVNREDLRYARKTKRR